MGNDSEEIHHKKLSPLQIAHRRNVLGTKDMFLFNYGIPLQIESDIIENTMKLKINDQYFDVQNHPLSLSSNKNNKSLPSSTSTSINEPPKKKQKLSHKNGVNSENKNKNNDLKEMTKNNINSDNTRTIIE